MPFPAPGPPRCLFRLDSFSECLETGSVGRYLTEDKYNLGFGEAVIGARIGCICHSNLHFGDLLFRCFARSARQEGWKLCMLLSFLVDLILQSNWEERLAIPDGGLYRTMSLSRNKTI